MARNLRLEDALRAVRVLADCSDALGVALGTPVVLVGGSALAAHGIRDLTEDVDLYAPALSTDAVHEAETLLRLELGEELRLDATSTENLWGVILVRDINELEPFTTLHREGGEVPVAALRLEDLYLLKLAADRPRDRADLPLIAPRTSVDGLVERFARLGAWHGDPGGLLGFADAFLLRLREDFGAEPLSLIHRLGLGRHHQAELRAAFQGEQSDG